MVGDDNAKATKLTLRIVVFWVEQRVVPRDSCFVSVTRVDCALHASRGHDNGVVHLHQNLKCHK